jgi:hypothetical protein
MPLDSAARLTPATGPQFTTDNPTGSAAVGSGSATRQQQEQPPASIQMTTVPAGNRTFPAPSRSLAPLSVAQPQSRAVVRRKGQPQGSRVPSVPPPVRSSVIRSPMPPVTEAASLAPQMTAYNIPVAPSALPVRKAGKLRRILGFVGRLAKAAESRDGAVAAKTPSSAMPTATPAMPTATPTSLPAPNPAVKPQSPRAR